MASDLSQATRDDKHECPRPYTRQQTYISTTIDCGGLKLPMEITVDLLCFGNFLEQASSSSELMVDCQEYDVADAEVIRVARSEAFQTAKHIAGVCAWTFEHAPAKISRSGLQILSVQKYATTGTAVPGLFEAQLMDGSLPSKPNPPNSPESRRATTSSPNSGLECRSDRSSRIADLRHSQKRPEEACSDADVPTSTPAATITSMPTAEVRSIDNRNLKNANAILPLTSSSRAQVSKRSAMPRKRRTIDTGELGHEIVEHAVNLVHRVLMGAQTLERQRKCPSAEEEWRKELLQLSPPDHMDFKELVNFYTDRKRKLNYRGWDADLLKNLACIFLGTEGLSAGQLSVRSRQRKYPSMALSLVNAASYEVGPVARNIFSALAAHSKSVTDEWCHYKSPEAAILVGKVAWARLKEHVDVTWKGLPMEMAIDPGSLLASSQRGFVALATLTVQNLRIGQMQPVIQPQFQPQREPQHQQQHYQLQLQLQRYQPQHQFHDQSLEQIGSNPFYSGLNMAQLPIFAGSTHLGDPMNLSFALPEGWQY
ncbi:hypothetical protein KC316_g1860 [Hortaea werneckii]|nr:hypothetical protein KC324_g1801 [Hortaea werneckii]KAI7593232.1 hypothetical protein KC316_g1860 [Hortaea werneckii]